jgi:hypothetical protein
MSFFLMMEAESPSKMSVNFYQTIRCNISENSYLEQFITMKGLKSRTRMRLTDKYLVGCMENVTAEIKPDTEICRLPRLV